MFENVDSAVLAVVKERLELEGKVCDLDAQIRALWPAVLAGYESAIERVEQLRREESEAKGELAKHKAQHPNLPEELKAQVSLFEVAKSYNPYAPKPWFMRHFRDDDSDDDEEAA